MKISITPNPKTCTNRPGGVNSVINDHTIGFLALGHEIVEDNADIYITHALASTQSDIFHCHGLYPIGDGYYNSRYSIVNSLLLKNAMRSKQTVCISEFSADILRHKLHISPHVTRNGIWVNDYKRSGNRSGPILFPKTTLDANSKDEDMLWLHDNTSLPLLSIAQIHGIKSTGPLNRPNFISTLSTCSIYLGTTKENNSMATMEAMIMGIPVVGYNIGFNAERLVSGIGCELVPFGDKKAIKDAIYRVLNNWTFYSDSANSFAQMFDWMPIIQELSALYEITSKKQETPRISIIIPSYNYAKYLPEAILSALAQTIPCEIIVVDDKSTDSSVEIASKYPVKVITNDYNVGVAETRNNGIKQCSGDLIICLDADDTLHPAFAETLLKKFDSENIAIVYGGIEMVEETGKPTKHRLFNSHPNLFLQATGHNQVPSCCMFRKSWWERAGGYNKRWTPAEDANLWLKIMQLGGEVKYAGETLMNYRLHPNSLSSKGYPEWWKESKINISDPITERDLAEILVVIDGYTEDTKDTLWSLENQTYKRWNCLLKNPNGLKRSFPWINRMIPKCSNESVIHIPAGTILHPNFLENYMSMKLPGWM